MDITLEEIRKKQITDAALFQISKVGIQNITMDDIAGEAGLSKGGIAHYFSSKEELTKAAFLEFFDRIFVRSKETMERYDDPLDQVLSFVWLFNWDDPDVGIGYPLLYDCISMAARNEDFRGLFQDWVNNWISLIASALTKGIEEGIFSISDIEGMARAISSIYQGIAMRWFIVREDHSTEWAVSYCKKAIKQLLLSDR